MNTKRNVKEATWHFSGIASSLLGEGRSDTELGASAKLDKELVLLLSSLFLGSYFYTVGLKSHSSPSTDSGHVLVQ